MIVTIAEFLDKDEDLSYIQPDIKKARHPPMLRDAERWTVWEMS
jgi:hypothetical protein